MDIDTVKKDFLEGNDFWAAKPIQELENGMAGAALRWSTDCANHLIEMTRPVNYQLLAEMLRTIDLPAGDVVDARLNLAEAIESNYEDALSLAVAHILCARNSFIKSEMRKYRTHLVSAMRLLGRNIVSGETSISQLLDLLSPE